MSEKNVNPIIQNTEMYSTNHIVLRNQNMIDLLKSKKRYKANALNNSNMEGENPSPKLELT